MLWAGPKADLNWTFVPGSLNILGETPTKEKKRRMCWRVDFLCSITCCCTNKNNTVSAQLQSRGFIFQHGFLGEALFKFCDNLLIFFTFILMKKRFWVGLYCFSKGWGSFQKTFVISEILGRSIKSKWTYKFK